MVSLTTELRNRLERVIIEARKIAEAGAKAALEALAVQHHEPYPHMDAETRRLRNHLRAHARQLGDRQDRSGRLEITHLMHECAYAYWHRMLFARFLAETNMLIEPEMQVAISLEEAEELARDAGEDVWTFASRCAQHMLPQIFRPEDPLLRVNFAREHRLRLETLLNDLEPAAFTADDSLGWVYQFWQSQKKKDVNDSGMKIGADELAPVTQLFTEDYMVLFLLHNTLGAWWAGKVLANLPEAELADADEDSLRKACSLPGIGWDYLRFVQDDTGTWRPAAGVFEQWPRQARDLRILDPCMGSGHFLVAELHILVPVRMAEEGLSQAEAVKAVLRENLFGLELDLRCTQIAAFNLALAAWKMIGQPVDLPPLNLACSGLAPRSTRDEWLQTLETADTNLRFFLGQLYDLFANAPTLGSLINPGRLIGDSLHADKLPALLEALSTVVEQEDLPGQRSQAPEVYERGVTAQGMAQAVRLLSDRYHLVATNVPYLGRGKQRNALRNFIETSYPLGKANLATAFVLRCLEACHQGGSAALVTPQNWLFLGSYKNLRERLLSSVEWNLVARLGARAFETITGEVVNVALLLFSSQQPVKNHTFAGLDVADERTSEEKDRAIRARQSVVISQDTQMRNPDAKVAIGELSENPSIGKYGKSYQGLKTGDDFRFRGYFWEFQQVLEPWRFFQSTVTKTILWGGRESVLRYENNGSNLARNQGLSAWHKKGVAISQMSGLPATLYEGDIFDSNVAPIVLEDNQILPALWAFCSSNKFSSKVRALDQKVAVANSTFNQIPFDFPYWRKVAAEQYPNGLPKPHSDDPTQWLFNGHPKGSEQPLHVAAARLLGYRWPRQTGSAFPDCPALGPDGLEALADEDGIVCIPSIRGERQAAERLRELLAAAFGEDWSPALERKLITDTGSSAATLDDWLRSDFFEQHCKLFHHRPFIWHIWDGRRRDGFHALVNYHKLAASDGEGRKLLESLTYSYLGDWIARQRDGVKRGAGGADDRLAAALELEKRLQAILTGEPPFDIFVRWKPRHRQPLDWEPDINDGVRLNIRPFMADALPTGRRGAGILRWKPHVKWGKDRGNEPHRPQEDYPWFWDNGRFTGNRVNDVHLSHEAKRHARQNRGSTAKDRELT